MLRLKVPISPEYWDAEKEEFIEPKFQILELEHSLVSISKWESKWCKPFLSTKEMSYEETLYYIECMTLQDDVDSELYKKLTRENVDEIRKYIYAPMTATTVPERKTARTIKETVTSELIYYWMIESNIPSEYQYWHLNRLLTLIKVCRYKNQDPKKTSKKDLMSQHAALNAANRARYHSRG